jgi:1,4-dihydroxy-2-naphthoate octaprenyltransferase
VSRAERANAAAWPKSALLARLLGRHEERLFSALGGVVSFQLLRAAHRIGLFAALHDVPGLTREQLARALGVPHHSVEVLLLGLVSMRIAEKIEDRFYLDPLLSGLLAERDGGLVKILAFFDDVINPAMAHLEESVRSGRPAGLHRLYGDDARSFYQAIGRDAHKGCVFQEAMRADTALNRERVAASAVFAGPKRVLDVGGGAGDLAMAIAARHPASRVSVLDFPEAADHARGRFRERGFSDRLDAVGVDLREGPLPQGYDVVLFAHFLDIFSRDEVRGFLAKAYEALPPGGAVCVFGSVMNDDERGPAMYGVLSSYFLCLADGRGRFYTAGQIAEALRAAGFDDIERTLLPRSEVMLHGVKRAADAPPRVTAFIRLGRPKFLAYSLLLYGLGSSMVVHEGRPLDPGRWAHGLAFVFCAHLMTHYANERFDLGADAENPAPTPWTGGSRVLVERLLPARVSLAAAALLLVAAALLALTLPEGGARWLAMITIALGWFYTAPPLSLNYRGLGEVTVATGLNAAVPLLAYGLQSGGASRTPTLLAIVFPTFVAQVARMLVMNLLDAEGDRRVGKRTLAVVLGPRRTRVAIAAGEALAYGSIAVLTAAHALPALAGTAMLLSLPLGAFLVSRVLADAPPDRAATLGFVASTHVAVLVAAGMLGLLASAPHSLAGAGAASAALCAAIVAGFSVLVAAQLRRARLPRAA